jgi:hypothetical protein
MKKIEIDDDVYGWLAGYAQPGESPSDVLRRVVNGCPQKPLADRRLAAADRIYNGSSYDDAYPGHTLVAGEWTKNGDTWTRVLRWTAPCQPALTDTYCVVFEPDTDLINEDGII